MRTMEAPPRPIKGLEVRTGSVSNPQVARPCCMLTQLDMFLDNTYSAARAHFSVAWASVPSSPFIAPGPLVHMCSARAACTAHVWWLFVPPTLPMGRVRARQGGRIASAPANAGTSALLPVAVRLQDYVFISPLEPADIKRLATVKEAAGVGSSIEVGAGRLRVGRATMTHGA